MTLRLPITTTRAVSVWAAVLLKTEQGMKLVALTNLETQVGLTRPGTIQTRSHTVVIKSIR